MRFLIYLFVLVLFTAECFAVDVDIKKLSNGQTVIVKEVHENPIVSIDTWVKTGAINENDTNNGVSHFLEHLFFKGTKKCETPLLVSFSFIAPVFTQVSIETIGFS